MSKLFKSVALAVAITTLAPTCAMAAGPSQDVLFSVGYIRSAIQKGRTTKAQVLQAFGQPTASRINANDSGSVEVLTYQRGAAPAQRRGAGFAAGLRSLAGIAGGIAEVAGYNNAGVAAARASYAANRVANGAEMIGAAGGQQQVSANGPNILVIELRNDVVSSWNLN